MEAVRSVKNQYLGINAHLHSFWQAEHKWNRFHNAYMTHLMEALNAELRPLNYTAELEDSVQVRRIGDDSPRRPGADLLIYDANPQRKLSGQYPVSAAEMTVAEWIEEEDVEHPYSAVAIYENPVLLDSDAVVWIELLSPTNKGSSEDAKTYLSKRRMLLDSEIVFVELDYLHETPPTFLKLLDYTDAGHRAAGAHPYRIAVMNARPNVRRGPGIVQSFDVDSPIPKMKIPLNRDDKIEFNFDEPYQTVFERAFYGDKLDYTQLPLNFDRYSQTDQARIVNRMLAVMKAARTGQNLEVAPLPTESLPLDQALAQLQKFT
jgi:hypothetical protein